MASFPGLHFQQANRPGNETTDQEPSSKARLKKGLGPGNEFTCPHTSTFHGPVQIYYAYPSSLCACVPNPLQRKTAYMFIYASFGIEVSMATNIHTFFTFVQTMNWSEEESYLLPTWAGKITYWHFDWMFQSSSGRKWRSVNNSLWVSTFDLQWRVSSVVHGYK